MIIKLYEQGILVGDGKYICHGVSEDGYGDEHFPPIKDEFAVGSIWEDTSEIDEEVMTLKWELQQEEGEDPAWVMIDPMTLDTDDKLYDVSDVKHAYVKIEG